MVTGKKGGLTDLFVLMVVMLVMVIFFVAMTYIANTTYSQLRTDLGDKMAGDKNMSDIVDETLGKVVISYGTLRWISLMLIIGYIFSILITSYLVKTNPAYFIPYIIIVIVAIIVSAYISNAWAEIILDETLKDTFALFTGANWIFSYLPYWIAIIGIFSGILMYANYIRSEYTL